MRMTVSSEAGIATPDPVTTTLHLPSSLLSPEQHQRQSCALWFLRGHWALQTTSWKSSGQVQKGERGFCFFQSGPSSTCHSGGKSVSTSARVWGQAAAGHVGRASLSAPASISRLSFKLLLPLPLLGETQQVPKNSSSVGFFILWGGGMASWPRREKPKKEKGGKDKSVLGL